MFASVALLVWPVVVIVLFRRLPPASALVWSILGGYLLLPTRTAFDFPLIPPLDKHSIPVLVAAGMALIVSREAAAPGRNLAAQPEGVSTIRPGWLPTHPIARILLALLFIGVIGTTLTNTEPLFYGPVVLPGASAQVALSTVVRTVILILPLLLARKFLAHPEQHRLFLFALMVAGLGYSALALFEIRMSPQLNVWIYGFFPHQFMQHMRAGGFRPVVFLSHGLLVGIFLSMAAIAAVGFLKSAEGRQRNLALFAAPLIFVTLVLSKTFGAVLIGITGISVLLFLGRRLQVLFMFCASLLILGYPALRAADLIPVEQAVSLVETRVSADRSRSLAYRFFHEDRILQHAREKKVFGWGQDARWRVFDEDGGDITVSDGFWAITFGMGGWIRYLALFGLLTLPGILFWVRRQHDIAMPTAALGVVLSANLFDLIPNSSFYPLTMLLGGALLGTLEIQRVRSDAKLEPAEKTGPEPSSEARTGGPIYTRQTHTHRPARRSEAVHSRFPMQGEDRGG